MKFFGARKNERGMKPPRLVESPRCETCGVPLSMSGGSMRLNGRDYCAKCYMQARMKAAAKAAPPPGAPRCGMCGKALRDAPGPSRSLRARDYCAKCYPKARKSLRFPCVLCQTPVTVVEYELFGGCYACWEKRRRVDQAAYLALEAELRAALAGRGVTAKAGEEVREDGPVYGSRLLAENGEPKPPRRVDLYTFMLGGAAVTAHMKQPGLELAAPEAPAAPGLAARLEAAADAASKARMQALSGAPARARADAARQGLRIAAAASDGVYLYLMDRDGVAYHDNPALPATFQAMEPVEFAERTWARYLAEHPIDDRDPAALTRLSRAHWSGPGNAYIDFGDAIYYDPRARVFFQTGTDIYSVAPRAIPKAEAVRRLVAFYGAAHIQRQLAQGDCLSEAMLAWLIDDEPANIPGYRVDQDFVLIVAAIDARM